MGRPPGRTTQPTRAQRQALEEIRAFLREQGYGPSRAELGERLGIEASSAHHLVKELVRKGYLRREPETARGLSIVRPAEPPSGSTVPVPLVGTVAAGQPILAEENVVGAIEANAATVARGRCFALQVHGTSMKKAGIADGDFVIVRQQAAAAPGDIVVALLDGEATVKTLFIDDEIVELRPENPSFKPIPVHADDDFRIVGKVVSIVPRPRKRRPPIKSSTS